jgi:hypothetical protein
MTPIKWDTDARAGQFLTSELPPTPPGGLSVKPSPSRSPGGTARKKGKGKSQRKGKGKGKRQKGAKGQRQRLVTIPGKGTVKGGGSTGKHT